MGSPSARRGTEAEITFRRTTSLHRHAEDTSALPATFLLPAKPQTQHHCCLACSLCRGAENACPSRAGRETMTTVHLILRTRRGRHSTPLHYALLRALTLRCACCSADRVRVAANIPVATTLAFVYVPTVSLSIGDKYRQTSPSVTASSTNARAGHGDRADISARDTRCAWWAWHLAYRYRVALAARANRHHRRLNLRLSPATLKTY